MKQLVDIIIYYDNEQEVNAYLEEVSRQTAKEAIAVVIVINKRGNLQLEDFRKKLDRLSMDVSVFDPDKNLGYLNGAIYGYDQYCRATGTSPEWAAVSNTDIEFQNNRFFEDFLKKQYADDVWCVAPSIYSPGKKSYDNPEYVDRCTKEKINQLIYINERPTVAYLYSKLARMKGLLRRSKKQDSQYIYSAKGCFFIIRNELAVYISDHKFKALLYSEESYIAELVVKYNKRTYYDSEIEVIHNANSVTGTLAIRTKAKYLAESLKIIRDEFYVDK